MLLTSKWAERIEQAVKTELELVNDADGSHDFEHFRRVGILAAQFTKREGGKTLIAYTAGILHDIISLPKHHPDAKKSSLYAADLARKILIEIEFPEEWIFNVCHAIHAHSFSAGVEPQTIEAMCVQDADRMEALGALGLMRVFYCSGMFGSKIMDVKDPAGKHRDLDDRMFALDHFPRKLLALSSTMKTASGRHMAHPLSQFLENYRDILIGDYLMGNQRSGHFKVAGVYQNAGRQRLALFHPKDPFAEKARSLDPAKYALDELLQDPAPFVQVFLKQLKAELCEMDSIWQ